jgi:nicotinamidase-related amidase
MQVHPRGRVIHKGINPNVDSYSAFFDNAKLGKTALAEMILEEGCTDVYVCGIATDVCVGKYVVYGLDLLYVLIASTAVHANVLGFRTILIDDCSRGINQENINKAFDKLKTEFACVVQSNEVWHGHPPHKHTLSIPG